ncbi:MAG: ASCH domain-containing protein [Firmicutes bacterium]|nr:ASCH domain-containing protein [Bacillota bacterium]
MEDASVKKMWQDYLLSLGETAENTSKKYSAWYFCDNEEDADELADLVIAGIKRATASLYLAYESEGEVLPTVGDHSIVTNWAGVAQCIIKTIKLNVVPFSDVSEAFAATEGEGDKSLAYWRTAHWHYFSREMKELGREPSEEMLVLCEEFVVVFP